MGFLRVLTAEINNQRLEAYVTSADAVRASRQRPSESRAARRRGTRPLSEIPALVLTLLVSAGRAAAEPRYTPEQLTNGVHAVVYNPDVDVEGTLIVVDSNAGVTTGDRVEGA